MRRFSTAAWPGAAEMAAAPRARGAGGRPVAADAGAVSGLDRRFERALEAAVARARAGAARVAAVEIGGARYWVKFARPKSWRVQLTKGAPRRLLAREVALLRAMRSRGAAVPEVVLAGADFHVTRDVGDDLSELVLAAPEDPAQVERLAAAGAALAALHARGMVHGRPYLRDLCWQAARRRVAFIDVERGARLEAGPERRARDVALMVLSVYALLPDGRGAALAEACLGAYFAAAPGMRRHCARFARRWRWLALLTAPARWHEARHRTDRRWKEYMALPLALAHLRRG